MAQSLVVRQTGAPTQGPGTPDGLALVIPVRGAGGKTRLRGPEGVDHDALARALAVDTVTAAAAAAPVWTTYVVTADPALACLGRNSPVDGDGHRLGAGAVRVVADPGVGLGGAIEAGLRAARATGVEAVGVLLGDLPALRPDDLEAAWAASRRWLAQGRTTFVPDAQGSGTVLLLGPPGALRPRFGPASARAHAADAVRLDLALPRLRRDVDDVTGLAAAVRLGVGPATAAALAGTAWGRADGA